MKESTRYSTLLTQRSFLKLTAANVVNRFGDSIDGIAIAWLMYEITHSAALVAFILGLNYVPTILLQPFTGAMVEHLSKKRVMLLFDIGRGLVVAAGAACYMAGRLTPALLTVMMLLISTLEAFRSPAGSAIVPLLLQPELYKVGSAFNQTAGRVAELIGLALAGSVVALLGCQGALLIDAATFFLSALIIGCIRVEEAPSEGTLSLRKTAASFREGMKLIRGSRVLVVLLLIGAVMNFMFVPLNAYATPFVSDYLGGGAEKLSLLNIVIVVMLGIGSFIAPKISRFSGRTQLVVSGLVASLALCGLGAGGYVGSPVLRYAVVFGSAGVVGFSIGVVNVVYNAAFLRLIPPDYMARLSGISTAILVSSLPIGSFLCSALAAVLPVPAAILASGALSCFLYLLLTRVKSLEAL